MCAGGFNGPVQKYLCLCEKPPRGEYYLPLSTCTFVQLCLFAQALVLGACKTRRVCKMK